MTLERKLLLLALIPLGFALVPAGILLARAQKTMREMERLDSLSSLAWRMADIERCLDLEQANWWKFTPEHKNDPKETREKDRNDEDTARKNTDAALEKYDQFLARVETNRASPQLKSALDNIATARTKLPGLREWMYDNTGTRASNLAVVAEHYLELRATFSTALPLLIDQTTNAAIVRKLLVLSKATAARHKTVDAGGYIFWMIQTYAKSKSTTPQVDALHLKEQIETAELTFAEIPVLSEGIAREKFNTIYRQPKWSEALTYARKFAVCLSSQTTDFPLMKDEDWAPYFLIWEVELGDYVVWLRTDFIDTCNEIRSSVTRQRNVTAATLLASILGLFFLSRRLARSLVTPLQGTASKLSEYAATFSDEAEKMVAASSAFSDGATQQATSLQQTSASLEELTATTKANAQTASLAVEASHSASLTAKEGKEFILALAATVADVEKSGTAISGILKTIDEIAFLTNILALNAAIEAARAGSAGAGFAVVAEEVRTLAQRSARAAAETTELLIGDASDSKQKGVVKGLEMIRKEASRLAAHFEAIVAKISETDAQAGQIARSSNEQAEGFIVVRGAIHNIDVVTQANVGASRNVAETADLLRAKADELKASAMALQELIGVSQD